jgi:hypothetical protein
MSGVATSITDANNDTTHTLPLVAALESAGVTRKVAQDLAGSHPEQKILEQLAATPYRRANSPAALLVSAIRGSWSLPKSLITDHQRAAQDAQRLQKRRRMAQRGRDEAETRQRLENELKTLSSGDSEALEAAARDALRTETPAAAALMLSRGIGAGLLRGKMLDLLASGVGRVATAEGSRSCSGSESRICSR